MNYKYPPVNDVLIIRLSDSSHAYIKADQELCVNSCETNTFYVYINFGKGERKIYRYRTVRTFSNGNSVWFETFRVVSWSLKILSKNQKMVPLC